MRRLGPVGRMSRDLFLIVAFLTLGLRHAWGEEPLRLREEFREGYAYTVKTRLDLKGQLTRPSGKERPMPPIPVTGRSAIDYDERVLSLDKGQVDKTIRFFRRVDFERKVGDQQQTAQIRPEARRVVLLRHGTTEIPFSPDGPMTWNELDVVRTDVFTPALTGLLPDKEVRPGDRWPASAAAVQELTDLEVIDEGRLECRLEGVVTLEKRRHARVSFSGTVRGPDEDGVTRHRLEGFLYFDLESNHLSYLSLQGVASPLKDGQEVGRLEGQFVLTRQAHTRARELSPEAVAGLTLRETEETTRLLFENTELGVRFLYPRRWRLAGGLGRQIRLDGKDGSGVQITLDPPGESPTVNALRADAKSFLDSKKATGVSYSTPRRLTGTGARDLEQFHIEATFENRTLRMDYYVLRQTEGGATIAASLPDRDASRLQPEVERLARSLTLTRKIK